MKKYWIITGFLSFFMLTSLVLFGQVDEEERAMALGAKNALSIELPDSDHKQTFRLWRDYGKKFGRMKKVKKADEWLISGAQVSGIGPKMVDLYARTEKSGSSSKLLIWIDKGDEFVSSDDTPKDYRAAVDLLQDFAKFVKVDQITNELADQEKALKKLETTLTKLGKDKENYLKQIEKAKETILKMESNIEQNDLEQISTKEQIEAQRAVVGEVNERLNTAKSSRGGGS